MKRKRKKKETETSRPLFHENLKGFDIKVNTFGELESNFAVDKLNHFLNEQVDDKKLVGHKGQEEEE